MAGTGEGHGSKAIIAAFFANLGIAIAKFVAFFVTGAASMLAEAIHSVADAGNQGLLLLGGRRAERRATATHQFGYGRARYFWSFIVAMVLFSLGGLFAIYEGVDKLRHPHVLDSPLWAVGVLILAIGLESFSFRIAIVEARPVKKALGWWQFIRRSKSPELPVVLLEDLGALVGLVVALVGVTLAQVTGNARWDAAGSLTIGILLVIIATVLAVEMKSLLLGESADPAQQDKIEAAIAASPSVKSLIHMRTQHLGPHELLVAAKIEFDHDLGASEIAHAIDRTETAIREVVSDASMIYIEPDIRRT